VAYESRGAAIRGHRQVPGELGLLARGCEDVSSAYERWGNCEGPQRRIAFESYREALDRKERAAGIHSVWTDRIRAASR
jgi:hypothetical protein